MMTSGTIIITTSPIPSNPSLEIISNVISSLKENPILSSWLFVLVCDGVSNSSAENNSWKAGKITAESNENYQEFKKELCNIYIPQPQQVSQELYQVGKRTFSSVTKKSGDDFIILEHSIRVGFALAVKSAFDMVVETDLVLINQHDWIFINDPPLHKIVNIFSLEVDNVNYIAFASRRCRKYHTHNSNDIIRMIKREGAEIETMGGLPFCRLYFCGRPHFVRTKFYRDVIFNHEKYQFHRGDFIEDTFGHHMMDICKREGLKGWSQFKAWLYYPDDGELIHNRHLNGRKFYPVI